MGGVPNGTWAAGEMLCSPGLPRQNNSLAVVNKSLYYELPSYPMSHFLSSSSFKFGDFFPILVSIKIEIFFFCCCPLQKGGWVIECLRWTWSGCVENGVWLLFFQHPPFTPSILPSAGLGLEQFVLLISSFLLIYHILRALAKNQKTKIKKKHPNTNHPN